ncbi:MAG: NAD(P)H-dependent oxidoreductase subunit E [Deltaproteobacteria bacterium]|jgi:NADH-quinone oxidoreductase subunit E|nr:NAD(P)H-dependent oxidoreductase subunit E [Deltaproteobacteria bacterium]
MENAIDLDFTRNVIDEFNGAPSAIIAMLQEIQEKYRYLPKEIFPVLSRTTGLSEARIYSLATFYENFSLEPKGRNIIKVCDGTACHVRKSLPILERLRAELRLPQGVVTTGDLEFTVEVVACLGACGLSPVLTLNGKAYPAMTPDKASNLLRSVKESEVPRDA